MQNATSYSGGVRLALGLLVALLLAPAAHAGRAPEAWPPREGAGQLFVHYGEEHWNDIDGESVLRQVVADVVRYRPDLVTMSGDKTDDGTPERLEPWRRIMSAYDRAGVPYMAGVGNHDGKQATPEPVTEAAAGSTPLRDISFYKQVFADRPYPMGDAPPYPGLAPAVRPPDDPEGASTHFHVDAGNVRWVFLDNSCYGIVNCDPLQSPPDGRGRSQYEFLRDAAKEAGAAGRLVFVVMHMPTRDPRDQQHAYYTSISHTMGKGISPDNQRFEQEAEALGVDAVFLGHIKGQFLYRGRGDIPYYIDGGAGGELYSSGPLGVDHGYWYGWRLLRVDGARVETDVVPVIAPGGMRVDGPDTLARGGPPVRFEAFARQPATRSGRGVVTALELRDPDPVPRAQQAGLPWWLVLSPLLLLPLLAVRSGARRLVAVGAAGAAVIGGGVAYGQRSVPTATPKDALPNPARIFTSSNPLVLAPVASETDDPRRDGRSQTADGTFRPLCPGRAWLTATSGWEQAARKVTVESSRGRIVRAVRRGRGRTLASVRLAQPAVVTGALRRRGRVVQRFAPACRRAGVVRLRASRAPRRGDVLEVRVRSDRRSTFRRWRVR